VSALCDSRKRFIGESGELVQQSGVIYVKRTEKLKSPLRTPKRKHYSHSAFWGLEMPTLQ